MSEQLRQEFERKIIRKNEWFGEMAVLMVSKAADGDYLHPEAQALWEGYILGSEGSAALQEKVERYEKALEFYAKFEKNTQGENGAYYTRPIVHEGMVLGGYVKLMDEGVIAKVALSSPTNEQEGDKRED